MNRDKFNLPKDFTKEMLDSGYSLENQGINEIAWKSTDAIKVIEFLCEKGYAILGGDVYTLENGRFVPTCDNWFLDKSSYASWEKYVNDSRDKAINYIQQYINRLDDSFYYVLVYDVNNS